MKLLSPVELVTTIQSPLVVVFYFHFYLLHTNFECSSFLPCWSLLRARQLFLFTVLKSAS